MCGGSLVDFFGKVHKMLKGLSQQNVTKIYHAVHPNGQTDSSSPLCIPVSRQSQNGKVCKIRSVVSIFTLKYTITELSSLNKKV